MELKTHICRQLVEKGRAFAQITLDDDVIVKDHKPDVIRVIYTKGEILLEESKAGNKIVWITGKLHFSTLYQSDNEARRLDSLEGDLPFQEKLVMEGVGELDDVSVEAALEDLSVGIINSRKLVIRAVISLSAVSHKDQEYIVTSGISENEDCKEKIEEMETLCLFENKKDVIRMQKEILLPNARTNVGEIIFYQMDFRNQEVNMKEDSALISMDAQLWVIYRSESTGEYECFETVLPLSGTVELSEYAQNEIYWIKILPIEMQLEPREDYDGERRMLGMEVSFGVEMQLYREESHVLLMDAYALDKELILEKEPLENNVLLMKNLSKLRILEQEKIEPKQERILQICGSGGRLVLDRMQKQEKGVLVEGIMFVSVLYNTNEDATPFASHNSQHPFEQFVEITDFDQDAIIRPEATIEQLQVNLLDNSEYEVKATIQISILATSPRYFMNIVRVIEEPLDMEMLQKQPGIIGVLRGEGEEIWDIAKKYHATSENIIEIGDKVLVVKQIQ